MIEIVVVISVDQAAYFHAIKPLKSADLTYVLRIWRGIDACDRPCGWRDRLRRRGRDFRFFELCHVIADRLRPRWSCRRLGAWTRGGSWHRYLFFHLLQLIDQLRLLLLHLLYLCGQRIDLPLLYRRCRV